MKTSAIITLLLIHIYLVNGELKFFKSNQLSGIRNYFHTLRVRQFLIIYYNSYVEKE